MVIKIKKIFLALAMSLIAVLLSGCQSAVLNPKGNIAADEKHIFMIATLAMLIVVIPVFFLIVTFAWNYRASNVKATYAPNWAHSTQLEIIWWSIPLVIVTFLGTMTWYSSHRLDPYQSLSGQTRAPITIQAIALQWKWLFIYPQQNIATVNFVEFPVGAPVKFLITAEGPMNSFQIQQLAGQIYAMSGMQTKLNLIANTLGDYHGISANFSGDGFSDMKFTARAVSPDDFSKWVNSVKQSPAALTTIAYNEMVKPTENSPVKYFSSAEQNIFETAMMKSMMPEKDIATLCNQKIAVALTK